MEYPSMKFKTLVLAAATSLIAFSALAAGNELAYKRISELSAFSGAPAASDLIAIWDDSAKETKKATATQLFGDTVPATEVTVALAASATTDGMDITITMKDSSGATVAAAHAIEFWMSENANCIGLTADTYSGTLTAGTGSILTAFTAKKHVSLVTAATGIAVLTLVDSANPADQYACVKNPWNGLTVPSAVSGTNWEGA